MKYKKIKEAIFLSRPNRFIANCLVDGQVETVHVKNTGRCKELLKEGATVFLEEAENPNRKTKYSLVTVNKNGRLINIDSQAPNKVVYDSIVSGQIKIEGLSEKISVKREVTFGSSRFDVFVSDDDGKEAFVEVKGVTLLNGSGEERLFESLSPMTALFPDAPTERGNKHVLELIEAKKQGYISEMIFLIQLSGTDFFTPNTLTDKKLSESLKLAKESGVILKAYETSVTKDEITFLREVEVRL